MKIPLKTQNFELNSFYRLTNNDIKKAAEVYARAYSKITLYEKSSRGYRR